MQKTEAVVLMGLCLSPCHGGAESIWYVAPPPLGSDANPGTQAEPFQTIQKGIDLSGDGDTIIVAEGTYVENIYLKGRNIVLRGTSPTDSAVVEKTIIDGGNRGSAVSFLGTEDAACVLSGFTITNGKVDYGGGILGGWESHRTHATIENNVIVGNVATREGGGLYNCDGLIQNNTIRGNSAEGNEEDAALGGGLARCHGTIRNNTICENSAHSAGGLWECDGLIQNNSITRNAAGESIGGVIGGLGGCDWAILNNVISFNIGTALGDCDAVIQGNIIVGNAAKELVGGLGNCSGTISNNVIAGNSAEVGVGGLVMCAGTIQNNRITGNQGDAGGLAGCDGLIRNNTIAGNLSTDPAGGAGGLLVCHGTIANCIIWGNSNPQLDGCTGPIYSCIQGIGGGDGNIGADPRFIDPDGPDDMPDTYEDNDFRLTSASPCIDKALNDDSMRITADLDGNPRIWRGLFSWTVDMGAYEYESCQFKSVEIAVFCLPPPGDCGIRITWNSRPGDTYIVMSCPLPGVQEWIQEDTVPSAGEQTIWIDSPMTPARKFYRIQID